MKIRVQPLQMGPRYGDAGCSYHRNIQLVFALYRIRRATGALPSIGYSLVHFHLFDSLFRVIGLPITRQIANFFALREFC